MGEILQRYGYVRSIVLKQLILKYYSIVEEPDFKKYIEWLADYYVVMENKDEIYLCCWPQLEQPFVVLYMSDPGAVKNPNPNKVHFLKYLRAKDC